MIRRTRLAALAFALAAFAASECRSRAPDQKKEFFAAPAGVERVIDGTQIDYPTWALASDPTLGFIDGQWHLFFNSIHDKDGRIYILEAVLPKGDTLSSNRWIFSKTNGKITPIISPSETAWDRHAVETADYIRGYDATAKKWVERLYFAGWPRPTEALVDYRLGFAQKVGNEWVKQPAAVFAAQEDWERLQPGGSFIGDEALLYEPGNGAGGANGTWHLWYQTGSKVGLSIGHATSSDGIIWENRKRMTQSFPFAAGGKIPAPLHLDVIRYNKRYLFFGWVAAPEDLTLQGLWMVSSVTPDQTGAGDFTDWKKILSEKNGPSWYYSGNAGSVCHSTGLFAPTPAFDGKDLWLLFTGVGQRPGANFNPCNDKGSNMADIGRMKIPAQLLVIGATANSE